MPRFGKYGVSAKEHRTLDGITFASKREMIRYQELRISERAGIISGLRLQPRYPLVVKDVKVCTYVADFAYLDSKQQPCIEDVKGMQTPMYKLKKKLFSVCYPDLRITEIL